MSLLRALCMQRTGTKKLQEKHLFPWIHSSTAIRIQQIIKSEWLLKVIFRTMNTLQRLTFYCMILNHQIMELLEDSPNDLCKTSVQPPLCCVITITFPLLLMWRLSSGLLVVLPVINMSEELETFKNIYLYVKRWSIQKQSTKSVKHFLINLKLLMLRLRKTTRF